MPWACPSLLTGRAEPSLPYLLSISTSTYCTRLSGPALEVCAQPGASTGVPCVRFGPDLLVLIVATRLGPWLVPHEPTSLAMPLDDRL